MNSLKRAVFATVSVLGLVLATPVDAQNTNAQNTNDSQENQLRDPPSAFVPDGRRASWHAEIERTERGYMIGNPKAEASLIEWISYTCGGCALFSRQADGAIDMALLAPGHMNVEVRSVIRNALDLTVSLLVQCGADDGFKDRHRMYLTQQETWLEKGRTAPRSQAASWASGTTAARISMASALDLDDMLANTGVSRRDITTCLSDQEAADALLSNWVADRAQFTVPRTPSFALDGEFLVDVHNWPTLYPVIAERFKPDRSSR